MLFAAVTFGQTPSQYTIETVATGMQFADGPVWSLEDFPPVQRHSHGHAAQVHARGRACPKSAAGPGGTAGNTYDEKGNLYTCEFRERRVTRTAKNGKVDVIAARFEGKRFNAPNDVVVKRDGNVYFTDPAFGNQEDTRELDFNGVFRVTLRGQVEAVAKWKSAAELVDALAQRPDALRVGLGRAVDSRLRSGSRWRGVERSRSGLKEFPVCPAGLRTDEMGNIYVAAKDVLVYSPQGRSAPHHQHRRDSHPTWRLATRISLRCT